MTQELIVYTAGGSYADAIRQAVVEPFEKETGVHVTLGVNGNGPAMAAILKASSLGGASSIDVIGLDWQASYLAIKQDLAEPLRLENIPSFNRLYPKFNKLRQPFPYDPGADVHGVPYDYNFRGIVNNTKVITREMNSVRELWNPEFSGKIGISDDVQWAMTNACLYTGQPVNKISDLPKIWDALTQQRKLVSRYFSGAAEGMELMRNGTIVVANSVASRAMALKKEGAPVRWWLAKEGAAATGNLLLIGKGTKNRYTAEKFIEFAFRPDIVTRTAALLSEPIGSYNVQSTSETKEILGFDPTGELAGAFFLDPVYWGDNLSQWTEKVREIEQS